ncbi:MAG: arabinose efflux permease family protein [Bacteroidetes bacterium]|nr:MAG: arabinose efflux permease family protein [Bacteroidota bacterium]
MTGNTTHPEKKDAFAALRNRDFSLFLFARFFLTLGVQVQSVVVGIQVYKLTGNYLKMGLIGLSEAVPFIAVSLIAGHVVDRVRRKKVMAFSLVFLILASSALIFVSAQPELLKQAGIFPLYAIIFCTGISRGFLGPAFPAYLAQLVPRSILANAGIWQSAAWQTAFVTGSAGGGLLIGLSGSTVVSYSVSVGLLLISLSLLLFVANKPLPQAEKKESLGESLTAGFRFVFRNQVMLSAFSLDLFAVLFGGAVAMIPAFAREVLLLGEWEETGVGMLRAAPAIGAILMGVALAWFTPTRHAGRNLLIAVCGFGLCIAGFALSTSFALSFVLLLLSGAFDQVSVVIRTTILHLLTPDHMRGRVSAVNGIFIGSSNEIGELESGVAAQAMGLRTSVVFGGCMTLLIAIGAYSLAPKLRKLNLDKHV